MEKDKYYVETMLQELEEAYNEGKIDPTTYAELRARYTAKLKNLPQMDGKEPPLPDDDVPF